MKGISSVAHFFSCAFLVLAFTLAIYGLFGLSHSIWSAKDYYYDGRLIFFDSGFYPFMWGVIFLVIGQLARLRYRKIAMLSAGIIAFIFLAWEYTKAPMPLNELTYFRDAFLDTLLMVCLIMIILSLVDCYIQRIFRHFLILPKIYLKRYSILSENEAIVM